MNRLSIKSQKWELDLSIVVPLKNEGPNVAPLKDEIQAAMSPLPYSWECLWIDDGSTDNTLAQIQRFNQEDPHHHYLALAAAGGQSAALHSGFSFARGALILTLDGDGQNDPADFARLIEHLNQENFDMVNGVRSNRRDSFARRMSSQIANGFRNWLTQENITDVGCSLRVFRHECVECIIPFKGFHRFLPTLIRIAGYTRIAQIPVNHRPRKYGRTNYGINDRLWIGLADTFAVRWMQNRRITADVKSTSFLKGTLKNDE